MGGVDSTIALTHGKIDILHVHVGLRAGAVVPSVTGWSISIGEARLTRRDRQDTPALDVCPANSWQGCMV
jgi:hypothetical protein